MTTDHKSAIRVCDQYHCSYCGKQWDVDDPEPPECINQVGKIKSAVECRDCDGSGKFYQMQDVDCHCAKPIYTHGVCDDGAAILKDGKQMTIEEILIELRRT